MVSKVPERKDEGATAKGTPEADQFDLDPSTPGRRVAHKKANSPFLVHQRWKAQQEANRLATEEKARQKMSSRFQELPSDAEDEVTTTQSSALKESAARRRKKQDDVLRNGKSTTKKSENRSMTFVLFKWSLVSVLLAVGLGQFIAGDVFWGYRRRSDAVSEQTAAKTFTPTAFRTYTVDELWQYNGQDEQKPIYLSILGNVYDVTPGRWIYGPRGSYSFFAGRDASRAFVTGCFETHLTHDLRGLNADELASIGEWKQFFDDHGRYRYIGQLDLPPIDKSTPIPAPCKGDGAEKKSAEEVAAAAEAGSS